MVKIELPHGYSFTQLDQQKMANLDQIWESQCAPFNEDYADYATPSLQHARNIAAEVPVDKRYGIFALEAPDGTPEAIVHLNHANLPGTTGWTLRVLWSLMSPKYDFVAITPDELSSVVTGAMMGVIGIAKAHMDSRHIKFHLGSMPDRGILSGMARTLENLGEASDVAIRGNWLHITMIQRAP